MAENATTNAAASFDMSFLHPGGIDVPSEPSKRRHSVDSRSDITGGSISSSRNRHRKKRHATQGKPKSDGSITYEDSQNGSVNRTSLVIRSQAASSDNGSHE